ncbi:MAG: hypothetical protein MUC29_02435 [Pyrinomonadaceae bacterium]|jgi:hypothetical protein|nr:hypothetical protein [Pyrinomonadaceae bacterium]
MNKISEAEFAKICQGIYDDREIIIKHNPIGTNEEILLWMLLSILISYLSLDEKEIPCFPNDINAETYQTAIRFILKDRMENPFELEKYLKILV